MITGDTLTTRGARATYFWGGGLFLGAGLCGLITLGPLGGFVGPLLGNAAYLLQLAGGGLFAAAIVVFAVGSREGGSAVARKPWGVASLIVFALLPLIWWIPSLLAVPLDLPWYATYVTSALQLASGLIGFIVIVRARAVPGVWRWLPLALFVLYAGLLIAYEALLRFAPPMDAYAAPSMAVIAPTYVLMLGAPFILGIPALVLAARARSIAQRTTEAEPPGPAAEPV